MSGYMRFEDTDVVHWADKGCGDKCRPVLVIDPEDMSEVAAFRGVALRFQVQRDRAISSVEDFQDVLTDTRNLLAQDPEPEPTVTDAQARAIRTALLRLDKMEGKA